MEEPFTQEDLFNKDTTMMLVGPLHIYLQYTAHIAFVNHIKTKQNKTKTTD